MKRIYAHADAHTHTHRHYHYLVSSADEVQVMSIEKFTDDISTKGEGHAPVIFPPSLHILVRVRPQEVTQKSCQLRWYLDIL